MIASACTHILYNMGLWTCSSEPHIQKKATENSVACYQNSRCVGDSNPWPRAWQARILTSWTNAPFADCDCKGSIKMLICKFLGEKTSIKLHSYTPAALQYFFMAFISSCILFKKSAAWAPSICVWWNWNDIGSIVLKKPFRYLPHVKNGLLNTPE